MLLTSASHKYLKGPLKESSLGVDLSLRSFQVVKTRLEGSYVKRV